MSFDAAHLGAEFTPETVDPVHSVRLSTPENTDVRLHVLSCQTCPLPSVRAKNLTDAYPKGVHSGRLLAKA